MNAVKSPTDTWMCSTMQYTHYPYYIHVYLDATGCMVQHVGLYMFKVLAIPWRCVE